VTQAAYQAFGLRLRSELALPGAWREPLLADGDELAIVLDGALPQELAGAELEWQAPIDGSQLTLERGADGSRLFRHASGRHLLSPAADLLRCDPRERTDPAWFRVLLDTVLLCVALLRGREGLHAAALRIGPHAVAIVGGPGAGKSTLLAALLDRGHELLADDITMLARRADGAPLALPGPPVMTLPAAVAPRGRELLMELGDERWVACPVAAAPVPLQAIVALRRRRGATTAIGQSVDAPRMLLAALLALPRTPDRALARLDLAAVLARHCRVLELSAELSSTPAELAVLLERAMPAG
jgi:hypothetical protein